MSFVPTLTSAEVCEQLGLTYRQLDYVADNFPDGRPGSGVYRQWDASTVARLRAAKALLDAAGWELVGRRSPWPGIVTAVMAGPDPDPGLPWVTLAPDGTVTYWQGLGVHPGLSARWQETAS